MGVPLLAGNQPIGVMIVSDFRPEVLYSPEQLQIFAAVADQAASVLDKGRLYRETSNRARQLATLNEVASAITSTLDMRTVLTTIMTKAMELLNAEAGQVSCFRSSRSAASNGSKWTRTTESRRCSPCAATEKRVGVDGMSTGARDQLYLALRIAALETHVEKATPLPVIVDDVLINFDYERAAAGLRVLAELATKTQVLLFTHHRHRVDVARATLGERVGVVELGGH